MENTDGKKKCYENGDEYDIDDKEHEDAMLLKTMLEDASMYYN